MEYFKDFHDSIAWNVIQDIGVLWSFLSWVWIMLPRYWKSTIRLTCRRMLKKTMVIDKNSEMATLLLDNIEIITGVDRDYRIYLSIDKNPLKVPKDFDTIRDRLEKENSIRLEKGETPVFSDLLPYAVHDIKDNDTNRYFSVRGILPYRVGKDETPVCKVILRKSSYFYSLISIMAMDEKVGDSTIREKYYKEVLLDPRNPAPEGFDIVHGFGMNTMVLTKDGSFVFSKRNPNTVSTLRGKLHVSVGEHLNQDMLDQDKQTRQPSSIETISKGILQELGITLNEEEKNNIRFYGVGFSKSVCQYGVFGFINLSNYSNKEIKNAWQRSKDGPYESSELLFIEANINSIVDFINKNIEVSMTKFALLNACLALMMEKEEGEVTQEEIDRALKRLRPHSLVD